jgi:hypothetical protein
MVTLAYSAWFLKIELKLYGLLKPVRNKFVILSFSMVLFSYLETLLDANYNIRLSVRVTGGNSHLRMWMNLFFITAVELHIYLLYLRTIAVLQFSPNVLLLFKCAVAGIVLAGWFEIVVISACFKHLCRVIFS